MHCMTFADTGKFRGIAFVTFAEVEGFKAALEMDGGYVDDKTLVVKPAKPDPKERAAIQKNAS